MEYPDEQDTLDKYMVSDSGLSVLDKAIQACQSHTFLYKYISANEAGKTGSHQGGFYIPNSCWPLMFDSPGEKGYNKDRFARISWNDEIETDSRFIWYGTGTRREYRLTQFGKGFPFLSDYHIGSLMVLADAGEAGFQGFILDRDDDIDQFVTRFNISPLEKCGLIRPEISETITISPYPAIKMFKQYLMTFTCDFPGTENIASAAREICRNTGQPADPDDRIVAWLDMEFSLFRYIEEARYGLSIRKGYKSLDEFLEFSNTVLNRRKSRAGKSLEHHLGAMFQEYRIPFTNNGVTEGNKKPDFIFPGISQYHDPSHPADSLIFLAAKTTCKDRWRQILNEAARIETKHLFTLQQGISANQMAEMKEEHVRLVIPRGNLASFPGPCRNDILTLGSFIAFTGKKLGIKPGV